MMKGALKWGEGVPPPKVYDWKRKMGQVGGEEDVPPPRESKEGVQWMEK